MLNLELTHLDLFSGIGGFAVAAKRCGLHTIGFSEIDPVCTAILRRNFPTVPNLGNIRRLRTEGIESPFLLTGGFPCQPFSIAGHRKGSADHRSLWNEMFCVCRFLKPRWIIAENVLGIAAMELDRILSDLGNINYSTGTVVLPACAVDAKHRRNRVWILAHSNSKRLEGRQHFEHGECEKYGEIRENYSHPTREWSSSQRSGPFVWNPEPGIRRVAYGIRNQLDRLRVLGNAIVPQLAEELIRFMIRVEVDGLSIGDNSHQQTLSGS